MPSDIAISVRNLTKTYRLFGHPGDRIKQFCSLGLKQYHREFTALKDVSFDIRKGETIGIIGRNGSGKSTLLQLICGILKPTAGTVQVNGRVSALLELGAGFNPEFTGRENVYFQGAIMGFAQAQVEDRFKEIVEFADIGEFIDQPVRTYSSGMFVRLAFAVQVFSSPDILIIDEALSVGDFFFQQRCLNRIQDLCRKGVTLLFVSHDSGSIRDLCRRTIFLNGGRSGFDGETKLALRQYFSESDKREISAAIRTELKLTMPFRELDSMIEESVWSSQRCVREQGKAHLIAVALYDEAGNPNTSFHLGSTLHIKIAYLPEIGISTHVTIEIINKHSRIVTSLGSTRMGLSPPESNGDEPLFFDLQVELQLEAGQYSLVTNLGRVIAPNQQAILDSSAPIGPIQVSWNYECDRAPFLGMVGLPCKGEFRKMVAQTVITRAYSSDEISQRPGYG